LIFEQKSLLTLALESYLRHRRQEQILEQLDETYSEQPDPSELPTVRSMKATFRLTIKKRW
jgi:hypothetical protein